MDVVASENELVSGMINREGSKDFVDKKGEFEELGMKFELKFSTVGTGFSLVEVEVEAELESSLPNAKVKGEVLETTGKQEEMFRLMGDVLVETLHNFFNLADFCFNNFLFSA